MNIPAIYRRLLAAALLISLASPLMAAQPPIKVHYFIHDDVPDRLRGADLRARQFDHWVTEMARIEQREIEINYISHAPGITSMDYENTDMRVALDDFRERIVDYRRSQNLTDPNFRNEKFLLFAMTQGNNVGWAEHQQEVGIASPAYIPIAAHELGHMFGALHDDGAQLPMDPDSNATCGTYMTSEINEKSCLRFSDSNRQRVAQYLRNTP